MASSRLGCDDGFTLAGRMCDRRAQSRLRTARLVQVAHDGDAAYARCRDFSDTGMKLDLTTPLELNDQVTVALSPTVVLCGTVAWINGRECGIAFDCPVDSAALIEAAEPPTPAPATPATLAMLAGRPVAVVGPMQRPSRHRLPSAFQPGLTVTIMVGPNREERGVVRWTEGNIAGLELEPAMAGEPHAQQALLPGPATS